MKILFKDKVIDTNGRMLAMGIHNAAPDSFSDGGQFSDEQSAIAHCLEMLHDGADIIDIGGESTKPANTTKVTIEEELKRVIPVITGLRKAAPDCVISIDTMKSEVAEKALAAGADIINDVSGLKYSNSMSVIASRYKAGLILMHMHGEPKSNIYNFEYNNLIEDVYNELKSIAEKALKAGVRKESIILDPGLGGGSFGKKKEQSLRLMANIKKLKELTYPILIGASRKGFIGDIISENIPHKRLFGNLGAAAWALANNADIIRVHDVKETVQLIRVYETIKKSC